VNLFALKLAAASVGIEPLEAGLGEHLKSLALPVLTRVRCRAAITSTSRNSRSAFNRRIARVGARPASAQIYFKLALKNAMVTVVTVVGLIGGHLLGGAVLVEQVFVIPGLGAMLVNGTLQKDFPTVQAVALALTIPVVLINLVVDDICATLDPRTRR
jgi:ABC-type dipeptide/oligopeptide/nickel transport system permease component